METIFAPGLVDSPPISIISAPSATSFLTCINASSISLNFPPSENESGVTLSIPIIYVLSPKLNSVFLIFKTLPPKP